MVNRLGLPYLGGAKPGPAVKDEQQEAHWATISVPGTLTRVRDTLRKAVDVPFDEISGSQSKRGFLLIRTVGGKTTACEVQLAKWEGGTQIQIAIPWDRSKNELAIFREWLQKAISTNGK